MSDHKNKGVFSFLPEAVLLGTLVVLALLRGLELDRGQDRVWHVPSILFASGMGIVGHPHATIPALEAYLSGESSRFDPADLPAAVEYAQPCYNLDNLRYLIVTQGLFLRVFGITHDAEQAFVLALYSVSIVLLYALMRLGMGRSLSFIAVALLTCSPEIFSGSGLRDFSKTPFFLAGILLAGLLIKWEPRPRRLLLSAFGLGLVIGLGSGFRSDVTILLPITAPLLVCCPAKETVKKWHRILSVIILAATAAIAGGGARTNTEQSIAMNALRMACGFSSLLDDSLHVTPASYDRMPQFMDEYGVYTAYYHAAEDGDPHLAVRETWLADPVIMTKYVFAVLYTFPGDALTRAYGSVYAIVRGSPFAFNPFFSPWLAMWGPPCALLFIACLMVKSVKKTFAFLYLFLALCGYTSIQFLPRHVFHLAFVPLWFFGATAQLIASAVWAAFKEKSPVGPRRRFVRYIHAQRPVLFRAAGGILAAVLLITAPLYGLRAVQRSTVRDAITQYQEALTIPVPTRTEQWADRIMFKAPPSPPIEDWDYQAYYPTHVDGTFYMVHLSLSGTMPDLIVEYEGPGQYTHRMKFTLADGALHGDVFVFFQVYERYGPWNWFAGISLPNHQQTCFRALYRVEKGAMGAPPMTIAIPGDREQFKFHQQLRFRRGGPSPYDVTGAPVFNYYGELQEEAWLARAGTIEELRDRIDRRPGGIALPLALSTALEKAGIHSEALQLRAGLLRDHADDPAAYRALFSVMDPRRPETLGSLLEPLADSHTQGESRRQVIETLIASGWRDWVRRDNETAQNILTAAHALAPESAPIALLLGLGSLRSNAVAEASAWFRKACPADALLPAFASEVYRLAGMLLLDDLLRMPEQLHGESWSPNACDAVHGLEPTHDATLLMPDHLFSSERNAYDRLKSGLQRALDDANATAARYCLAVAFLDSAAANHGESVKAVAESYAEKGNVFLYAGLPAFAEHLSQKALEWHPDFPRALQTLGQAVEQQGRIQDALHVYRKIMERDPEFVPAAFGMDRVYEKMDAEPGRITEWRRIMTRHPGAYTPRVHYGAALEQSGDEEGARSVYDRILKENPTHGWAQYWLGALEVRRGDPAAGLAHIEKAAADAPSLAGDIAQRCTALAEELATAGNLERAAELYQLAFTLFPDNLFPLLRLGEVYEAMGKVDAALNAYQKVLMEAPESPVTAQRMDDLMRRIQDDPHKRLDLWRDLVKRHPNAEVPARYLREALDGPNSPNNTRDSGQ